MNPFEMLYTALWELALADATLSEVVKVGNRVRFDSTDRRDPIKDTVQTADMPELMLLTDGSIATNLHASSCATSTTRRYIFRLTTGDQRLKESFFRVEWHLFCALVGWKEALTPLEWNGQRFVKNARLVENRSALLDADANRNLRGWSSLWTCEVDLYFDTNLLKQQLLEVSP